MIADLLAVVFALNLFTFPVIFFDALILFFVVYMIHSILDQGIDRAIFTSIFGSILVAIITALTANPAPSAVQNVFMAIFAPAVASVFFGLLVAELFLEYTFKR